jgi:crotonobetainyl-CoA:carnitine CoA-transferase CaiB-like acyl-CoA transferase
MTADGPHGIAGPLDGYTVVDFTHFQAGPQAAMILGDLGADVIKVEPPRGDPMRHMGECFVADQSAYFLSVNRNKRSVVIDLKHDSGRQLAMTLVAGCDVVLHNFGPGVTERLGLGYDHVRTVNPKVVYCAITAYGASGPKSHLPSVDPVIQAISGLMSITGHPDGPPTLVGPALSDTAGAILAVRGVLSALLARERFGFGQQVTASMLDGTVALLTGREGAYLQSGTVPGRTGNVVRQAAPSGTYRTSDGLLMITVINERSWAAFCRALDVPELLTDERFASNVERVEHRDALDARISQVIQQRPTGEWLAAFTGHGVMAGPVNGLDAALTDEQVVHNEMVVSMDHPTAGEVRALGIPVKLHATPGTIRRPPPMLGEHTREVLLAHGLSPQRYHDLVTSGVIFQTQPPEE